MTVFHLQIDYRYRRRWTTCAVMTRARDSLQIRLQGPSRDGFSFSFDLSSCIGYKDNVYLDRCTTHGPNNSGE